MEKQNKIPEKFLNDDGTVKTDALLKSYSELEKKIGTMVSVPGDDADPDSRSKFNRAIGVPDNAQDYPINDMFDDAGVREKFLEMGLTKTQVEKIYAIADEFLSPVIGEIFQLRNDSESVAQLKKFFGDDEKMIESVKAITAFGEKFLPADAFESLCASPDGLISVYKMMQSVEPDVRTDANTAQSVTDADLRAMMRDPKYWRDRDPEYVRKIENGFKKLYA